MNKKMRSILALVLSLCLLLPSTAGFAAREVSTIIIDDFDEGSGFFQMKFVGQWIPEAGESVYHNGTGHYTNIWAGGFYAANTYVTFSFYGTSFEVYGTKQNISGINDVYIDGVRVGEYDAYQPDSAIQYQQLLYISPILSEGEHTAKIQLTGRTSAANPNDVMANIDYIKVTTPAGVIPITGVTRIGDESIGVALGGTVQTSFAITPTYAAIGRLVYTSSNPDAATVDANGLVTSVAVGETVIRAASPDDADVYAECTIKVVQPGNLAVSFANPGRHYGVYEMQNAVARDFYTVRGMSQTAWSDVAWKGDSVNTQLVLSTGAAVSGIDVAASTLTSTSGATIPASAVSISGIAYVKASLGNWSITEPYELIPDMIQYPGVWETAMAANKVQSMWVSVDVPADAEPGVYTGTISVSADSLASVTLDVSIEVLDLEQPVSGSSYHLDLWQHPYTMARYYDVEPWSVEHLDYLRGVMELYRDAGGGVITTNIVNQPWFREQIYDPSPSMVAWTKHTNGSFSFDFTEFDTWVQLCLDMGIDKQISCYSIAPDGNKITYFNEATNAIVTETLAPEAADNSAWRTPWQQFLEAFVAHLDDKGWFDITYIAMDERPLATMRAVIDLVDSVTNQDGKTLKISGAINYASMDTTILDRIDDLSVVLQHIGEVEAFQALAEDRRALGLNTTIYACTGEYPNSFTYSYPSESAWLIWYSQTVGADGFLRWALDAWNQEPTVNTNHINWETGDCYQIYPADGAETLARSSLRFEMLSQAIRDVEKLNMLKEDLSDEVAALYAELTLYEGYENAYMSKVGDHGEAITADVGIMRNGMIELSREYLDGVPEKYTVTFNSNGGSAVAPIANVRDGSTIAKPSNPVLSGYTFDGWYKDPALTTAWNFSIDTVTANITLYAKWTEKSSGGIIIVIGDDVSYTVTFNANGGSAVAAQTVTEGDAATKPTDPTRDSYTFGGWFTDAACTKAYDFNAAVTADITLYALWAYQWKADAPSTWAQEQVIEAIENGLVPADLQQDFKSEMNRLNFCRMAIQFLTAMEYDFSKITPAEAFGDCDDENVLLAAALGIVEGIGHGNFAPDRDIRRDEAACMLARLCEVLEVYNDKAAQTEYADQDSIHSWANAAVNFMFEIDVMTGASESNFDPYGAYTAETAIVTFQRLLDWMAD